MTSPQRTSEPTDTPRGDPPDRRAADRYRAQGRFLVAPISAEGRLGPVREMAALDLSEWGMRLVSDGSFAPGDLAVIQLVDRGGDRALVGITVVHASSAGGMGVRFTRFTEAFIRARLAEDHPRADPLRPRPLRGWRRASA
jgi:hypothetical protein